MNDFDQFDADDLSIANVLAAVDLLERKYCYDVRGIAAPADAFTAIRRALSRLQDESGFICRHCGQRITYTQPRGAPLKTICEKPDCQRAENERQKRLNAERQARYRQRHKDKSE